MNPKVKSTHTGIRLISASITVALLAVLVGIVSALAVFSPLGVLALGGLLIAGFLLYGYLALSFFGKLFCLNAPVGRALVGGSLALDVIVGGLTRTHLGEYSGHLGTISGALFLGFLYQLGQHVESQRLSEEVLSTVKKLAFAFVLTSVGAFTTKILSFVGLCFGLGALFSYLAVLRYAQEDLANYQATE